MLGLPIAKREKKDTFDNVIVYQGRKMAKAEDYDTPDELYYRKEHMW